eukprot:5738001-Pleurochrysis_carterae.AAC.1
MRHANERPRKLYKGLTTVGRLVEAQPGKSARILNRWPDMRRARVLVGISEALVAPATQWAECLKSLNGPRTVRGKRIRICKCPEPVPKRTAISPQSVLTMPVTASQKSRV